MKRLSFPKRGSALLIVLGLLSFLLISAVAFSISMRTESAAASAYRRSIMARELLTSAFADARATLLVELQNQRERNNFDRNDPKTYTPYALFPFYDGDCNGNGDYFRVMSSTCTANGDAGVLDDAVMRHIPPYVVPQVFECYEMGAGVGWQPLTMAIPENEDALELADGTTVRSEYIDETKKITVGRFAWSAINLSDALDINAIGSNSAYRGLGLTGSEFAFGTMEENPTAPADERANFFEKQENPSAPFELPIFCSNADLSQYAARNKTAATLSFDNGTISPFSWEEALAREGDGWYSPFSVYSFWPHPERTSESGTRRSLNTTNTGSSSLPSVNCSEVTETSIGSIDANLAMTVEQLAESAMGQSGGGVGTSFARLLLDYIDANSILDSYDTGVAEADLYNNAIPTVENVPMVSEVGFTFKGWESTGEFLEEMKKSLEDAFPAGDEAIQNTYDDLTKIPDKLEGHEIELKLPAKCIQQLAVRAYFPGYEENTDGSYTVEIDPTSFAAVFGAGENKDGSTFEFKEQAKASTVKISGDLSVGNDLFTESSDIELEAKLGTVKIDGANLKITREDPDTGDPAPVEEIKLSFLVDFLFRVQVSAGGDIVDLCPTDRGDANAKFRSGDYPETLSGRTNAGQMAKMDAQFFRITRPVTVTFALQWHVEKTQADNNGQVQYTATAELHPDFDIKVVCDTTASAKLHNSEFQPAPQNVTGLLTLTPEYGAWYTIDPRYNWISPILGVSGTFDEYFTGAPAMYTNLSSPHWVFQPEGEITSGSTEPSEFQKAYEAKHTDIVPFSWGLTIEDIRYGYNDAGQILLPAEVGFLPVPCTPATWTPNLNYKTMSVSSYHNSVAKMSFFRTLPVADLEDGAMDYDTYVPLASMFQSFGGAFFPEEHRGIVHAFAGMDDYYLAQQMRQFAMLGIPPSIKQAAYVTRERLKIAAQSKRIKQEVVTNGLQALNNLPKPELKKPKYDEFITDYLFPLPDQRPDYKQNEDGWDTEQELYKGVRGTPTRPKTKNLIVEDDGDPNNSFAKRLEAYNETKSNPNEKLGQNDMTTLLAMANECFGDRQQLFLIVLRADAIRFNSSQRLSAHTALSTARAVVLLWCDAYGELPDRVIYYQYLP